MNHNKDRYYVFVVDSKDELQVHGNIEGYINHGEAVTHARSVRRPGGYGEPPVVYIFRAIPIWKFDDVTPEGTRIQRTR